MAKHTFKVDLILELPDRYDDTRHGWKYKKVPSSIYITVDPDAIAKEYGRRAATSKGKRSMQLRGAVAVEWKAVR